MTIPLSTYQRIGVSAMSGECEARINEMKERGGGMCAGRDGTRWDKDNRTEGVAGMEFIGRSGSEWTGAYGQTKARHTERGPVESCCSEPDEG